jgi:predicted glycoside hydrolase/deacetylase ChbG (UPF0249 family)
LAELLVELMAQIDKTRDLVDKAYKHVDFHMGLHRLPGLYRLFLEVAEKSGVGRIRTHRYRMGMENRLPRVRHALHLGESPTRLLKFLWNLWLRKRAVHRCFAMPDRWVGITHMGARPATITVENYLMMLRNLPHGFNEFVAHPGYIDDDLQRWSTYLDQRLLERQVLLSPKFRQALWGSDIRLAGYRDIPLQRH